MTRLTLLLFRRSLLRSVPLAMILALVGAISFIFAWMSPSLRAAELVTWQRLPGSLTIGDDPSQGGDCLAVYDLIALTTAHDPTLYAHPVGLVGDAGLKRLGLAPRRADSLGVIDELAAVSGGLADGDEVTALLPGGQTLQGPVEVAAIPVSLVRRSAGSFGLNRDNPLVGRALHVIGPAETSLCFGGPGPSVDSIRASIQQRQEEEGLTSSTAAFAGIALGAWSSGLLLSLSAVHRRRKTMRDILISWGERRLAAALVGSVDVLAAAWVGLGMAVGLAWWLRSNVLHLWTAADAVLVSTIGVGGLILAVWFGLAALAGRRTEP